MILLITYHTQVNIIIAIHSNLCLELQLKLYVIYL